MKVNPLLAIAITLIILSGFSCKKQSNAVYVPPKTITPNTNPPANTKKEMKDFFSKTKIKSQAFTGAADNVIYVKGEKGTEVFIYPGSLIHKDGTPVTGNVQIELIEIYKPGEMILSNATTTSNGQLLQSGGEIYLMAKQNGEELRINKSNPVNLLYATDNPQSGMILFNGGFVKNGALAADSSMNWEVANTDSAIVTTDSAQFGQPGTGGGYYNYSFVTDSFGWSNCDRFWNLSGGTDPMVSVPDSFDSKNTCVYMIFDAEKSVADADIFNNQIFRFHSGEHTPVGLSVTIVAIAKKDDKYYYDIKHYITEDGKIFAMNMQEAALDEIKAAVGAL